MVTNQPFDEDEEFKLGRLHEGGEDEELVRALIGHGRASPKQRPVVARVRHGRSHPRLPGNISRLEVKEAIRTGKLQDPRGSARGINLVGFGVPYGLIVRTIRVSADGAGKGKAAKHQLYICREQLTRDGEIRPHRIQEHEVLGAIGTISDDAFGRLKFWNAVEKREARKTPASETAQRSYGKPVQLRMICDLPYGLHEENYLKIAQKVADWITDLTPEEARNAGYSLRCHLAIHRPPGLELTGPEAGRQARNIHLHVVLHDRPARRGQNGDWEFAPWKCGAIAKIAFIREARQVLCGIMNKALEQTWWIQWRYHPGSYRKLGLPIEPLARLPVSHLQRPKTGLTEPKSLNINKLLILGRDEQVLLARRSWGAQEREKRQKERRQQPTKPPSARHTEDNTQRNARKLRKAEAEAETFGLLLPPASPRHYTSYEMMARDIANQISIAPESDLPPTTRQIQAVDSLLQDCGLEDLSCDWQRDRGTAGIAVRLLLDGLRTVPPHIHRVIERPIQPTQVDWESRRKAEQLEQDKQGLAEQLRALQATLDRERAEKKEVELYRDDFKRYCSRFWEEEEQQLATQWVEMSDQAVSLREGKVDNVLLSTFPEDFRKRLKRLPSKSHIIIAESVEKARASYLPSEPLAFDPTDTASQDQEKALKATPTVRLLRIYSLTTDAFSNAEAAYGRSQIPAWRVKAAQYFAGAKIISAELEARGQKTPERPRVSPTATRPNSRGYER